MAKQSTRLSRGEKALLYITAIIVLIVGGGFFYWQYLETDPVVSIPTPVLPSPNAYDEFVRASAAVKDPDQSLELFGRDYRFGAKIIPGPLPTKLPIRSSSSTPAANPYWQKELDAALAANAPAIKILRDGFRYPCVAPTARSLSHEFPEYTKFRGFARMMNGYGSVLESKGEYGKAMDCYLDATRLGVEIPHGSTIIGMLVGTAMRAIVQKNAWECSQKLTAPQARVAARRMEEINGHIVPLADVLQEEKWFVQASLMEAFRQGDWRKLFTSGGYSENHFAPAKLNLYTISKRKVMANVTRCMNEQIEIAKQPYSLLKRHPELNAGDAISDNLILPLNKLAIKTSSIQTQSHLLAASLALRAYRLEHGAYPASLNDLVTGKYLTAVPSDPFANKAPVQYKRVGASYVLYSIGPDTVDDGGKASADGVKGKKGFIGSSSTGDIMAGVNVR